MSSSVAVRRLIVAFVACLALTLPASAVGQEPSAPAEVQASFAPTATSTPSVTSPEGAWAVAAYDAWGQGLAEPRADSDLRVSLLEGGRLEGETACGRFDGGWFRDGAELSVGVAPTGNLGCGEKKAGEAIGLSTALDAVVRWQATDTGIELIDGTGATRVMLQALSAADPVGDWSVSRYRRPNGKLIEPPAESPMFLALIEDGSIEGSSGCRLLLGEYRYQGAGITIGPIEAEGLPCDGDEARAERQLLRALGDVVYWEQEVDRLTLMDGFDELLVELARVADPPAVTEAEE